MIQDLAELKIRANAGIVEHGPAPSVGLVAVITHDRVVMAAFDTLRVVQDDALEFVLGRLASLREAVFRELEPVGKNVMFKMKLVMIGL